MKSFADFLAEKREVAIHTLASYLRLYIQEQLQPFWREHYEELLSVYQQAGDPAYGVFGRKFFGPVQEQFAQAGFTLEPEFPGNLPNSLEQWGPPEERERCMWSVVRRGDQTLGTLVLRIFHDHTKFRLPAAPIVLTLEETEREAIIDALSHGSTRLQTAQHVNESKENAAWQYSVEIGLGDYLRFDENSPQISEGMLDYALAQWGRYGWELVNVIPNQGHMIAFFKRPAQQSA